MKSFTLKEKLFPSVVLSNKSSRTLESRCSQVALFLPNTGNSTYSDVFFVSIFLEFAVFSRKCHKFLRKQLKTI